MQMIFCVKKLENLAHLRVISVLVEESLMFLLEFKITALCCRL